jgi:DNA-binding transcriptional MocR family regulator
VNRVRWVEAAEMVRKMIKAGEILPGDLAPSAVELAGRTGVSRATCRKALLMMAKQGELLPPVSRASRPRVPGGEPPDRTVLKLSSALATARRAAGLTQAQLAERAGLSTWSVHSAETAEFRRPAPERWAKLDQAAGAGGELVRMHADWQASREPRDNRSEEMSA